MTTNRTTDSLCADWKKNPPCQTTLQELWQRHAYANDAGPYLLIPQAVMQPRSEDEVQSIILSSRQNRIPICFRAGGTSLSGQSVTDGWLVDIGRHWRKVEPMDHGNRVRVQGGAIGGLVNARLKQFNRKIGPDPSSINSAMMGGILSNNSSGMCCGVQHNAYHTVESIRFILPDGSVWDTSLQYESDRFDAEQSTISKELLKLREEIVGNASLSNRIREKYKQKNTVGYSLNAFLDFERSLDILAHLLIGGEGTLAFISEAVLRTLPDHPSKATSLSYFADARSACESIPRLIDIDCDAVEFMDRASLESIRNLEGVPEELLIQLDCHKNLMGLLFEFQASSDDVLREKLERFHSQCAPQLQTLSPVEFTHEKKKQANIWKLRKGMYPAVAAVRGRGEAAILEDVTFPIERLGPAIIDLQSLFEKHRYSNGIIFGHARDGNLHFVITQTMSGKEDTEKYSRFIDDMVELVVHKYDGALKAEHGTGRNMAPFVETEWGPEATAIMRRLKKAIDPESLFNPDVILTNKPRLHIENIKDLPVVEEIVDKCIECGACEPRCPSRDFTLSPRQRIVLRRSRARMIREGKTELAKQLDREFEFAGKSTCATDGLCALDCPVAINTGELIKELRANSRTKNQIRFAALIARHFGTCEKLAKTAIGLGRFTVTLTSSFALRSLTRMLARLVPGFPQWHASLSWGAEPIQRELVAPIEHCEYLYLPACMSRMMGGTQNELLTVCQRAEIAIHIPKHAVGTCCGQAFSSKGFVGAAVEKQSELIDRLWEWSDRGRIPIVIDLGSCTSFLRNGIPSLDAVRIDRLKRMTILDSVELAHILLPKLKITKSQAPIAIHSVCSNHKSGIDTPMLELARRCSSTVIQPHEGKCCGMGGDRGFEIPFLIESAGDRVRPAMDEAGVQTGYTNARSCAISLSSSSGHPWKSIFHLLEERSRMDDSGTALIE